MALRFAQSYSFASLPHLFLFLISKPPLCGPSTPTPVLFTLFHTLAHFFSPLFYPPSPIAPLLCMGLVFLINIPKSTIPSASACLPYKHLPCLIKCPIYSQDLFCSSFLFKGCGRVKCPPAPFLTFRPFPVHP